jgi:hypothetical protein
MAGVLLYVIVSVTTVVYWDELNPAPKPNADPLEFHLSLGLIVLAWLRGFAYCAFAAGFTIDANRRLRSRRSNKRAKAP